VVRLESAWVLVVAFPHQLFMDEQFKDMELNRELSLSFPKRNASRNIHLYRYLSGILVGEFITV
jgi:hypothetical protein